MSSLNESIYRFAFCVENHLLLAIFLKLTLVLAVMWLFALALRRSNPQWRILVWRLGSISILLAIGTSFLPGIWRVEINAPEIAQVLPRDNSLTSSWVVLEYNEEGLTDPKTSEAPATHGSAVMNLSLYEISNQKVKSVTQLYPRTQPKSRRSLWWQTNKRLLRLLIQLIQLQPNQLRIPIRFRACS